MIANGTWRFSRVYSLERRGSLCDAVGRLCFALSFCPAHLHLHSNAVLDLEHDLWCLHAVNMVHFIIFTDSTDHLQLRMSLLYKDGLLGYLALELFMHAHERGLDLQWFIIRRFDSQNDWRIHTWKCEVVKSFRCMWVVLCVPVLCSRDAMCVFFFQKDTSTFSPNVIAAFPQKPSQVWFPY